MRMIALSLMLALGACSNEHMLASCHGPFTALNMGLWQPPANLQAAAEAR